MTSKYATIGCVMVSVHVIPLLVMAAVVTPHTCAWGGAPSFFSGPVLAQVERVVDGDTVRVKAHIWIDQSVSVSVRVADIDAPELFRPKCHAEKEKARAAKDFAADFIKHGNVRLYNVERGKYAGRVVARVENEQGQDLATALEGAGLAQRRARGKWCA